MGKLIDIPYSKLKENERDYEIMLLHDQHDNSYTDIAKEFKISISRVAQLYYKTKLKQLRLYARHLAIVHGHNDTSAFQRMPLYDCYRDYKYISAYWEKEYAEILKEYRAGEPGHSAEFLAELPPSIKEVSDDMIQRVRNLREDENKTFIEIGREMKMTKEKVRDIYYGGNDDWDNLKNYYNEYRTAKKRFEGITKDYPKLLE